MGVRGERSVVGDTPRMPSRNLALTAIAVVHRAYDRWLLDFANDTPGQAIGCLY